MADITPRKSQCYAFATLWLYLNSHWKLQKVCNGRWVRIYRIWCMLEFTYAQVTMRRRPLEAGRKA